MLLAGVEGARTVPPRGCGALAQVFMVPKPARSPRRQVLRWTASGHARYFMTIWQTLPSRGRCASPARWGCRAITGEQV